MRAAFVLTGAVLLVLAAAIHGEGEQTTNRVTEREPEVDPTIFEELNSTSNEDVTGSSQFIDATTDNSSPSWPARCRVHPTIQTAYPGETVEFRCSCHIPGSKEFCPDWRGLDDVWHMHSNTMQGDRCNSTLKLRNVDATSPKKFYCADITSDDRWFVSLAVSKRSYDGLCQVTEDCEPPYECANSKCDCKESTPVFIPGSIKRCYPARKLFRSCFYSSQCVSKDEGSYCDITNDINNTGGVCLCKTNFEVQGGVCVRKVVWYYKYTYSSSYRVVWWILFALIPILLTLTLLRIYRYHKQRRQMQSQLMFSNPLAEATEPKKEKV